MKNERKIWTKEDVDFLKKNYPKYGAEYCSEKLFRNKRAIIKRANILKIKFEGIKFKYLKENLEPIVKECKNISEVLKKIGLRAAGGSHATIKSYIKKYNLDTSHFKNDQGSINLEKGRKKIDLVDILVENSTYSRSALKNRLYNLNLKKRECEKCGQGEEWNGEHMSLILDHINGVNNDNRIVNIRILCPNCNATLPTHAGRNTKKTIEKKLKKIVLKNKIIDKFEIKIDGRKNPRLKKESS